MMAICIEMSSDAQKTSHEFRECRAGDDGMSVGGAWPGHDHTNDAERDFGRRGDSCGRIYREVKLAPVSSKQQVVLNSDQGTPGSAKHTTPE